MTIDMYKSLIELNVWAMTRSPVSLTLMLGGTCVVGQAMSSILEKANQDPASRRSLSDEIKAIPAHIRNLMTWEIPLDDERSYNTVIVLSLLAVVRQSVEIDPTDHIVLRSFSSFLKVNDFYHRPVQTALVTSLNYLKNSGPELLLKVKSFMAR